MIPAMAVIATAAVETAEPPGSDAVALTDGDADGRFAAALQQLLGTTDVPATNPGAPDLQSDSSGLVAADLLEQSATTAQPQDLLAAALLAPPPAEVPPAAGPLQWMMLLQATMPLSPDTGAKSNAFANTTDSAQLLAEVTLHDSVVDAPASIPLEAATSLALTDVLTARAGEAATPGSTGDEVSLDPTPGEPQRVATGLEHSSLQRITAEAAPRPQSPALSTPLHASQWGHDFAARVNWIVERGDQFATIRLTPEELGPVEVRVAIREGETSIWFGATQAETRAAIEQALPRLREMLAANGLSLADSGVFQQAPRDPRQGFTSSDARRAAMESATPSGELLMRSRHLGLIDDYA